MTKSYLELINLKSYEDRFKYLLLKGFVGEETFGSKRYLNQKLYTSKEWKDTRDRVIIRDDGCDLGHPDHSITGHIYIHHINPITADDIINRNPIIFDMNNLISVSRQTHDAIHYGNTDYLRTVMIYDRMPNDTCPWKK